MCSTNALLTNRTTIGTIETAKTWLKKGIRTGRKLLQTITSSSRYSALKYDGIGTRHICKICGKDVAIFDEDGKWFIEG